MTANGIQRTGWGLSGRPEPCRCVNTHRGRQTSQHHTLQPHEAEGQRAVVALACYCSISLSDNDREAVVLLLKALLFALVPYWFKSHCGTDRCRTQREQRKIQTWNGEHRNGEELGCEWALMFWENGQSPLSHLLLRRENATVKPQCMKKLSFTVTWEHLILLPLGNFLSHWTV